MFKKSVSLLALAAMLGTASFSSAFAATDKDLSSSIRKQISAADSEPFSHAKVQVMSRDGTVYLRGSVDNISQLTQIEALAANTDGVKQLVNQLKISDSNK